MKEFKKSDLTETMVCFSKIGYAYGFAEIKDYDYWNDDLSSRHNGFSDIVVIYDLKDLKPIWQRENPIKKPIVLNEREKSILVAYSDYKWIARDSDNEPVIYKDKPEKHTSYWVSSSEREYYIPSDLFQFVKWEDEEPTSLDELRGLK